MPHIHAKLSLEHTVYMCTAVSSTAMPISSASHAAPPHHLAVSCAAILRSCRKAAWLQLFGCYNTFRRTQQLGIHHTHPWRSLLDPLLYM